MEEITDSMGPGNVLMIELAHKHITEVFTGFGMKGKTAETVAKVTARHVKEYLEADAPVGRYLADQLLLLMAAAGGGSVRTLSLSRHSATNMEIIKKFLEVSIRVDDEGERVKRIEVG